MKTMTRAFRVLHAPKKFRNMVGEGLGDDMLCLFLEMNRKTLLELKDKNGVIATQGFKFLDIGYIDGRFNVIDDRDHTGE